MIAPARRTVRRLAATKGVGTVLLGLSVLMLAATVTLGVLALDQARSQQSNVAYTQEAVDSNVRTPVRPSENCSVCRCCWLPRRWIRPR